MREERRGLCAVDAPVQQFDVLRLARQHVDQVEAREIRVLELRELVPEHDATGGAVAVEQREFALRLGGERRADNRQERRDPAASREADVVACAGGVRRQAEVTKGRHDVQRIARRQRFPGPGRERSTGTFLHCDAQRAVLHGRADRIRAPDVFAADRLPHGYVLARLEPERRREFRGHGKRERDGIARLALDFCNPQRMKLAHQCGLK